MVAISIIPGDDFARGGARRADVVADKLKATNLAVNAANDVQNTTIGNLALQIASPGRRLAGQIGAVAQPSTKVVGVGDDVVRWLGKGATSMTNAAGDTIIQSADGLRVIRTDINRTHPHKNPHIHVIQYAMEKNVKVQLYNLRIFPLGVTPE
jgi:hypothetical protein